MSYPIIGMMASAKYKLERAVHNLEIALLLSTEGSKEYDEDLQRASTNVHIALEHLNSARRAMRSGVDAKPAERAPDAPEGLSPASPEASGSEPAPNPLLPSSTPKSISFAGGTPPKGIANNAELMAHAAHEVLEELWNTGKLPRFSKMPSLNCIVAHNLRTSNWILNTFMQEQRAGLGGMNTHGTLEIPLKMRTDLLKETMCAHLLSMANRLAEWRDASEEEREAIIAKEEEMREKIREEEAKRVEALRYIDEK